MQATTRPRAILALSCLADEPDVGLETAMLVCRTFAASLTGSDGQGSLRTPADIAAVGLAGTEWSHPLQEALVQDFQTRYGRDRWNVAWMCGMLGAAGTPSGSHEMMDWLADSLQESERLGINDRIIWALTVQHIAYQHRCPRTNLVCDALRRMLLGDPDPACAAAWALTRFYPSSDDSKGCWSATPAEVNALTSTMTKIWADETALLIVLNLLRRTPGTRITRVRKRCLRHSDVLVREEAVMGLAQDIEETDRFLLTQNFDGEEPWIDPQVPIDHQRVLSASASLQLTESQIRRRYEQLAPRFGLGVKH